MQQMIIGYCRDALTSKDGETMNLGNLTTENTEGHGNEFNF